MLPKGAGMVTLPPARLGTGRSPRAILVLDQTKSHTG